MNTTGADVTAGAEVDDERGVQVARAANGSVGHVVTVNGADVAAEQARAGSHERRPR